MLAFASDDTLEPIIPSLFANSDDVPKGDIINTIEPKDQGLQVLRVYKQNEDGTWNYSKGYLQIGSELD